MYCTNCGRPSSDEARFCTACGAKLSASGQPPKTFKFSCSTLLDQLDTARKKWFELMQEIVADQGISIQNTTLEESCELAIRNEDIPGAFPYKAINGETVEAFIIGLQLQVALAFALGKFAICGKVVSYLTDETTEGFFTELAKTIQPGDRWNVSLVTWFGEPASIDEDFAALIVAQYWMNDPAVSPRVATVQKVLGERMAFLRALSCLGAAVAFSDIETAQLIMRALKS